MLVAELRNIYYNDAKRREKIVSVASVHVLTHFHAEIDTKHAYISLINQLKRHNNRKCDKTIQMWKKEQKKKKSGETSSRLWEILELK